VGVARSDGNEFAEFDAWRMHATGYEPDPWMRKQVSFQREDARWKAAHLNGRRPTREPTSSEARRSRTWRASLLCDRRPAERTNHEGGRDENSDDRCAG
jgi:hypothetical protein